MPSRLSLITAIASLCLTACTTSHEVMEIKAVKSKVPGARTSKTSLRKPAPVQMKVKKGPVEIPEFAKATVGAKKTESTRAPAQIESRTLANVAADLGLSAKQLKAQGYNLDQILRDRSGAKRACRGWKRKQNKKMCSFLSSLHASNSKGSFISRYLPYVPLKPSFFKFQQKLKYEQLRKSLRKRSSQKVLSWVNTMTKTRGCPRNLSAASLRKLEPLLPDRKAIAALEKLYRHASYCLRPSDPGYEIMHFRQALLRHRWGMPKAARESIAKAAKATKHYERERVLFWAGRLLSNVHLRRKYWKELTEDFPLSYHSLEAWRFIKRDPYEFYTKRPYVKPSRLITRSSSSRAQEGMYWFEALTLLGKRYGAQKLSRKLMTRFKGAYSPGNVLYFAEVKEDTNTKLSAIGFLSSQIKKQPAVLNRQSLRILFPKPYFSHFERAEKKVNTDPFLMLAVARQESAFNPRARSRANARGLLQILPSTARQMTGKRWNNLYNPRVNVDLGSRYLSQMIRRFGGVEKALAAYNAGPSRVVDWQKRYGKGDIDSFIDLIPFRETRNYVSKIIRNNYWYERIYSASGKEFLSQVAGGASQGRSKLVSRLLHSHTSNN